MLIHVGPEEMPGRWVTGSVCYSEDSSLPHVCLLAGISSHTPTCPRKNIVFSQPVSFCPAATCAHAHSHTPAHCCALLVNSFSKPLLLRICSSRLNPSPFGSLNSQSVLRLQFLVFLISATGETNINQPNDKNWPQGPLHKAISLRNNKKP